ncbi:flagellar biosynthesis protein [Roseibium salinum]|uniref:Flagellar biosynthesis protein n=1 Tax=Roseibium salinum TaxID=1604349 RepID=A0ABT3R9Y6_9HYPH|nr:flagellar biosynthesis protein [Roseibium sp. DSM 29163]MCX2725827.1 flagellar biosynthesis protein [Roseibium sp. DSM 29163]
MAKVGNYVQREYHSRFGSQRKKTWSDYNKGWTTRRANALKQTQQLRNIANNFSNISIHSSQANTVFVMQNQSQLGAYASPTAVMSRINVVV